MKITGLERFVMLGLWAVAVTDGLFVLFEGSSTDRSGLSFVTTVLVVGLGGIGMASSAITGPIWLARIGGGLWAWLALAGALLMAAAVFSFHGAGLAGTALDPTVSMALVSVGCVPVLAASFLSANVWFPKRPRMMFGFFAAAVLTYVVGYIVRFTASPIGGTVMLLMGTAQAGVMYALSYMARRDSAEFHYEAKPVLVAPGAAGPVPVAATGKVTYGSI